MKSLLIIPAIIFTSSCTQFHPLPIPVPSDSKPTCIKDQPGKVEATPIVLKPTTLDQVRDNLVITASFYQRHANGRAKTDAVVNDFGYVGALGGLAGGVWQGPEYAVAGAVTTGTATNFRGRYSLSQQRNNYQKAADTFEIMAELVVYYQVKGLTTPSTDAVYLIERLRKKVIRKLRAKQTDLEVETSDFKELIAKAKEAGKAVEDAEKAIEDAVNISVIDQGKLQDALINELQLLVEGF